jgi:ATP phosphoribosyltransferase regulatory subunit
MARRRMLIPADLSYDAAVKWRKAGWTTVSCLGVVDDLQAEARRLDCTHALIDGTAIDLSESMPDDF